MPQTSFEILDDCFNCTRGSAEEERLRALASLRPRCREAALLLAFTFWYHTVFRADASEMVADGRDAGLKLERKFGLRTAFWAIGEVYRWLEIRSFSARLLDRTAKKKESR